MKPGFKPLPLRSKGNCFGCGSKNASGLKMVFASDGRSVATSLAVPSHLCGWSNIVHGGVIATILDETMGWTAIYLLKKLVLTKSLQVDFMKPVLAEKPISAQGLIVQQDNDRQATVKAELVNAEEEVCARATGVFSLFTVEAARNLGFLDESLLQDIAAGFFG